MSSISQAFCVASYNVLAQAYVKPHRYRESPAEALEAGPRSALLREKLSQIDADIYCLQEVEAEVFAAIQEWLPEHQGNYAQKPGKPDGCALFVRQDAFAVESSEVLHYEAHSPQDAQLALIGRLRHVASQAPVVVVSTHLRWQPEQTPAEHHIGCLQMLELLKLRASEGSEIPWLIAGDLNAISQSIVVEAALEQGFRLSCRSQRPWDTTNINGRRRKLDYILYEAQAFRPEPRQLPQLQRRTPMPSHTEPSDHLAVVVDFSWM